MTKINTPEGLGVLNTPENVGRKLGGISARRVQQLIQELALVPMAKIGQVSILSDAQVELLRKRLRKPKK